MNQGGLFLYNHLAGYRLAFKIKVNMSSWEKMMQHMSCKYINFMFVSVSYVCLESDGIFLPSEIKKGFP